MSTGKPRLKTILAQPTGTSREDCVEADRLVFAKAASLRRLCQKGVAPPSRLTRSNQDSTSSPILPPATPSSSSRNLLLTPHTTLIHSSSSSSLSQRPATATTNVRHTHSRVHQVLHHSESEFALSTSSMSAHETILKEGKAALPTSPSHSPQKSSPTACRNLVQLHSTTNRRPATASAAKGGGGASKFANVVKAITTTAITTDSMSSVSYFIQRKRRCAKTFADMIFSRLHEQTTDNLASTTPQSASIVQEQSVQRLLDHGIIQSVLALSTIADPITQAHCCRALYYLAKVPIARKPMISQGVVVAIKTLSRIAAPQPKQDLAAALAHLSEECGLAELLLFEGIDRSLLKLLTAPASHEIKRICAVTVFNLSVDASCLKHFGECFAQLLVSTTRLLGSSSTTACEAISVLIKAVYNASLLDVFHDVLMAESIPRFLVVQLIHVPPETQVVALRALCAISDAKSNRMQLVTQNNCKLLADVLCSPNTQVQETCLLVLLLFSMDDGSRIKLCNWLPIAILVLAATNHVANAKQAQNGGKRGRKGEEGGKVDHLVHLHSCILRNLCDSVLTHHEIVEAGGVRVLLEMSRMDDNQDVKSNAICALCCIIASSTEESAGYVVEITEELIKLTTTAANCLFAVGALYNIACSDECLPLLVESPTLVERMLALARVPHMQPKVIELVAAIIYRLAGLHNLQPELLRRGVFAALVHVIHHFPTGRTAAVNALFLLADQGGEHFPHGGEEIAHLAVALSQDGANHRASTITSSPRTDITALRSAVTLLAHLANHRKNHSALVRNGAVFRFLKRLRHVEHKHVDEDDNEEEDEDSAEASQETIVINCAFVFYCLTATYEGCEQLIKEQCMDDLIHLSRMNKLSIQSNHDVKELCMLALCRISSFVGLEVRLIEHGAIDAVLVLALVTTDNPAIKALCIKMLSNCLAAKNCVRPLIEHGIIWALSSLCVVDFSDTRYACAVSLCNLSAQSQMLSRFLDAGAPRALMHLLQRGDSATVLVAIKAIANLVANEKLCGAFLNEDATKHLNVHFADPNSSDELRQLAAMVLLRVTSANENAMISLDHLKHGVFLWMEQIIVMKDAPLVRNCMLTVHDLTCNVSLMEMELDVDHILRIVGQVFTRHHDSSEIVTLCLSILYNLSCHLPVLHKLLRPDIMTFIRQHVPLSPSLSSSSLAISSSQASSPPSSSSSSSFRSSRNNDVKLCGLILHNLSCFMSSSSIETNLLDTLVNYRAVKILHDIYVVQDDLKESCAVAVCNIAVAKVNTTRVLEDHAGAVLLDFIFSGKMCPSHHHLMAVALRKLTNAPGNQNQLLDAGIAQAIVYMLYMLVLPEIDDVTCLNLLATLCSLSKCVHHVPRLLKDDVLPCVIRMAEIKLAAGGSIPSSPEFLWYCFEIISNVCTVDFEEYVKQHSEMNVINILTKLSEQHNMPHGSSHYRNGSAATSPVNTAEPAYYDRGEEKPLPLPQLLKFMMKSPSSSTSVKKNLELQTTYTVPAQKWVPEATPVPKDPPPLECKEIPLTETNQSIPPHIKQTISNQLVPLPKQPLVHHVSTTDEICSPSPQNKLTSSESTSSYDSSSSNGIQTDIRALDELLQPRIGRKSMMTGSKKLPLQRGHAGRNLSLSFGM